MRAGEEANVKLEDGDEPTMEGCKEEDIEGRGLKYDNKQKYLI